jgi:hypothetical protein
MSYKHGPQCEGTYLQARENERDFIVTWLRSQRRKRPASYDAIADDVEALPLGDVLDIPRP